MRWWEWALWLTIAGLSSLAVAVLINLAVVTIIP